MSHLLKPVIFFGSNVTFTFLFRLMYLLLCFRLDLASQPIGVKRIHKDIGLLTLPVSAFSASSVYKNQPEYQAHKANFVVFAPQEQFAGAWCPAKPVQNQLSEWLQIDFNALKIMRVLFTEGRGNNPNAYMPAFLLRYQRQDGHRWYDYRMRNGTKILYANHNSQTIAISLDPPIIARRFRLYPYSELEPRLMCLRLAVYGSAFEDGVTEYMIPEGAVYRMNPRIHVSLNDTIYDGSWMEITLPHNAEDPTASADRKAYFYSGLGLLTDKYIYEGQLPEPDDNCNVVGWFRRQYSTPSDRVVMMFTFDQVRNFTQIRIHALNSLDYVALFRRIAVQFSLGGQHFDRRDTPVVVDVARDTHNREARWVSVDLGHRIGRYVRVTLWFDYDWIVLSEVAFDSVPVANATALPMETSADPVQRMSGLVLTDTELTGPWYNAVVRLTNTTDPLVIYSTRQSALDESQRDMETVRSSTHPEDDAVAVASVNGALKQRSANTPYVIVVLCCCFGSIAFATLFVFLVYRFRRYRQKRLKKLSKASMIDHSGNKQHQLLLHNSHQNNHFFSSTPNTGLLLPDASFQSVLSPNSFQYNPLKGTPASGSFGQSVNLVQTSDNHNFATLTSPDSTISMPLASVPFNYPLSDSFTPPNYKQFVSGFDQDSVLALQLIPRGSALSSNFPSLGGVTLSRRGGLDTPSGFASQPFVSMSPGGFLSLTQSTSQGVTASNTPVKLAFCPPPPPPDQPLPPIPPPSTSPDSSKKLRPFTDTTPNGFVLTGTLSPVAPYSASHPTHSFAPDTGLILPIDASIPEYASASLFSGSGSIQQTSTHIPLTGSINSKSYAFDPDMSRFRSVGETYCIPHQNSIHSHCVGVWTSSPSHFTANGLNLLTGLPSNTVSTIQRTTSDGLTGSLDSSGMYYLANPNDPHLLEVNDPNVSSRNILVPFASAAHLLPIHGMVFESDRVNAYPPDSIDESFMVNNIAVNSSNLLSASVPQTHPCALVNGMGMDSSHMDSKPDVPVRIPVCQKRSKSTIDASIAS